MARPILYIAITNHGFGHATRMAAVADRIQKQLPDVLLILVTTAPRWLLDCYIDGEFIHRPRALDVGVVQTDSFTMDKPATLEKLMNIRSRANSIIASEVSFIQQNRVQMILADIPPLAALIGQAAGIPCWMVSNFGWDYIYTPWGGDFAVMADWIAHCFQHCDRLFRLPFHESMGAFPVIEDVGLTGGVPRYSVEALRGKFQFHPAWIGAPQTQTVLMTFGGLGVHGIPYGHLLNFPNWQFITFDSQAPDLPNLLRINDRGYRPVDLMPLCGLVLSKPGYGTFAEACRLGLPIVSLTRDDFAETPLLLEGIRDYAYHRIISPAEFAQPNWDFLEQPPYPPRIKLAPEIPELANGNHSIAQAVVNQLLGTTP